MTELFVPCFLTTITTAVGFAAIAISQIPQIKQFGIYAAAGVLLAFILTILFVPSVLVVFGHNKKAGYKGQQQKENSLKPGMKTIHKYLAEKIAQLNVRYARVLLIVFSMLVILALLGIRQIDSGTNMYSMLKEDTAVNRSLHFIEDNISMNYQKTVIT